MDTAKICQHCGKPLGSKAVQGLCAECFFKVGLGTGPSKSNFVPPAPEALAPHFPQLEVLELLGKGGMGAVYKARQAALNRFVALKILPPDSANDPAFAERFAREAQAMARLSHSNIVTIHEFGQSGGFFYFVMEFVDGINLRQMIRAHRLAPREAMAIVPQICEALQYAHDQGIVHRDIKPENVLVDKRGRVKIADFGLARLLGKDPQGEPLTRSAEVMGTPHYMAPEQLEKPLEVDHRADIYSLGVVFYEMLTGELPLGRFPAPSRKVEVDVRLDEIVLRALEKEPELRYQQASAFRSEVETVAHSPSQPDNCAPHAPDRKFIWSGVAIGCALLVVIAAAVVIPSLIRTRTAPAARVESPTNAFPPTNLVTHEEWSPSLAPDDDSPGNPTNPLATLTFDTFLGPQLQPQLAKLQPKTNSTQDELQILATAANRPPTLADRVEQFIRGANVRTNQQFEVFQKSRRPPEGYRIRYNVKRFPLREPNGTLTNSNSGEVFYLSASNRFYIQWDSPNSTTLHYYGPFDGNPIVSLQLPQPSREDQERDLNSRFEAARSVDSFAERDTAMAGLARDAAVGGFVEAAHKAIDQIVSFTARDRAAEDTARELQKAGHRDEAISIAKMITSFTKRDAVLADLAK